MHLRGLQHTAIVDRLDDVAAHQPGGGGGSPWIDGVDRYIVGVESAARASVKP